MPARPEITTNIFLCSGWGGSTSRVWEGRQGRGRERGSSEGGGCQRDAGGFREKCRAGKKSGENGGGWKQDWYQSRTWLCRILWSEFTVNVFDHYIISPYSLSKRKLREKSQEPPRQKKMQRRRLNQRRRARSPKILQWILSSRISSTPLRTIWHPQRKSKTAVFMFTTPESCGSEFFLFFFVF